MKITIQGGVYFDSDSIKYPHCFPKYRFISAMSNGKALENCGGSTLIVPHRFEVDIPDDFDPRPGMVQALQKEREKACAEFAARVREIDRQISSLLAIENGATA